MPRFGLPEDPNQLVPQSVEIDHQLDESENVYNILKIDLKSDELKN